LFIKASFRGKIESPKTNHRKRRLKAMSEEEKEVVAVPEPEQNDQITIALGTERELKVITNSETEERPRQYNRE
jgi:hypothetical protein